MAGAPQPILPGTPAQERTWKATGCCPSSQDSRSALPCCGSEPASSPWRAPATCAAAGAWCWSPCSIAGCGLWWPGHFLEPGEASGGGAGGIPLVAAGLALALAGLAGATAMVTTRKTLPAFAGLSLLTLGVAYAHSLFATPGLFRASAALGSWGPAGAILVLVDDAGRPRPGVQVEPQGPDDPLPRRGGRRPAADARRRRRRATAASALLPAWTEALLLAALVATGAVLLEALGTPSSRDPEPARRAAAAAARAAGRQPDPAADARLFRGPPRRRRDQVPTPTPAAWRCSSSTSTASSRSTTPTATRSATSCSSRSASA